MAEELLFFKTPHEFRLWLQKNHEITTVQWVGFYKKTTKIPSITWPESVDQALCFGWIDGLRKSIDTKSYAIRFTPRRPNSHWSAVNYARIAALENLKLVMPAGLAAYRKSNPENSRLAAYEQSKEITLSEKYQEMFQQNPKAWQDFTGRAPSYKKQCIWWIMSAKREETQERRLVILINSCQQGQKIPPLRWQK